MRFAKIAAAAVVLGLLQLAFGWRLSLAGAAPDVLFVLAAFATLGLRPAEGVPAACAVGLLADILVGGRLGLEALGYGLGARVVEGFGPIAARWGRARWGPLRSEAGSLKRWLPSGAARSWVARALARFMLVLAGAAVAHGTAALLGYAVAGFGGAGGTLGVRVLRAAGISFLTAAAAPVLWPVLALSLGDLGGRGRARAGAVEA